MSERGSKRVFTYGDEDDVSNVRDRNQQVHRTYQLKDWKSLLWAYCRNYGLDWLVLFMMAGYTLFAYVMKPLGGDRIPCRRLVWGTRCCKGQSGLVPAIL
eukprot:TRINITY_DN5351_c0_g1_i2.p1 TRINITY_DN5351_c0_g1~~TRINITY_DN5351_c0_g1_i2.p1  ORF type:complete len:100 (+),score=3.58 TRINITY_DN5351_c0_g1_i2:232-531(+)